MYRGLASHRAFICARAHGLFHLLCLDQPPEFDPDTWGQENPITWAWTRVLALLVMRGKAMIRMCEAPLGMLITYTHITSRDDCYICMKSNVTLQSLLVTVNLVIVTHWIQWPFWQFPNNLLTKSHCLQWHFLCRFQLGKDVKWRLRLKYLWNHQ